MCIIFIYYVHVLLLKLQNNFECHEQLIQDNYGDALLHILEKAPAIENTKEIIICTVHPEPQQEHAAAVRHREDRGSV